jgi:PhnB protein
MIVPAISFPGTCAQAIAFYQTVFDLTNVHVDYYRDAPPDANFPVGEEKRDWVMHAEMTLCGSRVNMSDGKSSYSGHRIVLNVFLDSGEEVSRIFDKLKQDGVVRVELGPQFFSPMYGAVEDQFGVYWQLIS